MQAKEALRALRAGQRDLKALDLSDLSSLSLGVIEDFENEVTPLLATRLAEAISHCEFVLQPAPATSCTRASQRESWTW